MSNFSKRGKPCSLNAGVSVAVHGTCVTRNGESEIGLMRAALNGTQVKLGFVSRVLKRDLHAGATMRVEDLDMFCRQWIDSRGFALTCKSPSDTKEKLVRFIGSVRTQCDQLLKGCTE